MMEFDKLPGTGQGDWLAQDADGTWWAYEAWAYEPNQQDRGWYENEVGRILRVGKAAPPGTGRRCC
jgi:hypothetical protein